jgi:glycosyltransferase involved in cell wall biosynthesis
LKIWFRVHGFELCSWTFVWDSLRDAFERQGDEVVYSSSVANPEEWIELWWGDPQFWQWSGLPVKAKMALALSEAHSILKQGRRSVIDNLNEADVIICPSEFATTAFKEAPIDTPIKVAWFGVNEREFKFVERKWNSTIKYLHGGATQFRKGSWMIPEAFVKAFKKNDDVTLTIACPKGSSMFDKMRAEYGNHPKIEFICKLYESAMDLYSEHHVYISPHLSEGFGLQIPEAMSTGMPCLVARCSSPREFFDAKYGWWIEMSENYAPVCQCLADTNGYWRLPDVDSLAECMKESFVMREETEQKGRLGSEYVRKSLTWDICATKIKKIIKEVLIEKNLSDNSSLQ